MAHRSGRSSGDTGRLAAAETPPAGVLHLDLDAFFASVEQLRQPHLRGRPVIVGAGVIASCSYEARRLGLRAGMRLSEARQRCPEAVILPGHAQTYRCFAEAVFAIANRFSPAMETFLDEAYLDLAGTENLHRGGWPEIGRLLQAEIRREVGLQVSIGMAGNRMVAKMVTRMVKPNGVGWCDPGCEEEFVAGRPVQDLPGVGPRVGAVLRQLNVLTVADLRRVPEDALVALFGAPGRQLYLRCRGRDTTVISAREIPHSIRRETSFHRPAIEPEEMEGMLHYLCVRAVREARRLGLAARTLRVHLRYSDGESVARAQTLPAPTGSSEEAFGRARLLFRGLFTRRVAVHNLGVELSGLVAHVGEQLDLWDVPWGGQTTDSSTAGWGSCGIQSPEPASGRGDGTSRMQDGRGRRPDGRGRMRRLDLEGAVDRVRDRFGFSAVTSGPSLLLMGRLARDRNGFVLRTPSLTK
jgi:DNA polymerase IV